MLVKPRHEFDEVARPVTIVELVHQDLVPGVTARAGRARQTENVGGTGDTGGRTRLDRGSPDLGVARHQEQRREAIHALFEQRLDRLGGYVATGEAGAPGRNHDVDRRIGDPGFHLRANLVGVIGHDRARGDRVPGLLDPFGEGRARFILGERTRVGHGEHRDLERHELARVVDTGHDVLANAREIKRYRNATPDVEADSRRGRLSKRVNSWRSPFYADGRLIAPQRSSAPNPRFACLAIRPGSALPCAASSCPCWWRWAYLLALAG